MLARRIPSTLTMQAASPPVEDSVDIVGMPATLGSSSKPVGASLFADTCVSKQADVPQPH